MLDRAQLDNELSGAHQANFVRYAIYYTPLNRTRDGGFRRVRVEMTNHSFRATTRVGYFAPKS